MSERERLKTKIADAIRGAVSPAARDALLAEVAAWQAEHNPVLAKLCRARAARFDAGPDAWPALPTDVFRFARVSTHDASLDVRTFLTSGTTSGARGAHVFRDLFLYDLAAETAARDALFPERERIRIAMLAPHPDDAPDSSLSYMLGRFEHWFASETFWCWRGGALDLDRLHPALLGAVEEPLPIVICGTSFAFVHADETMPPSAHWRAPRDSRAMPTGGFKGRSREVDPAAMRTIVAERFGIEHVIGEYGMTELSSQMYEFDGHLRVPPWVRATPVDPETLRPVREGQIGILRIDDLANLDSAVSIQTADLARLDPGGRIALIGRAPGATPRGCSLATEEALS
ncbi:MAG: acyl-protein synthetase [Myxococcota bacterium]|nr:acyl-protein synthetase [Myxococcota bacterium]